MSIKIGILSDSHKDTKNTKLLLGHLKENGAEYFVHAGDFEKVEDLQILHEIDLPYVSVFGNNDFMLINYQDSFNIYKEPHFFSIKSLKFKLMHMPVYMSRDEADIIIYGHTHEVDFKYNNGLLTINPGEICARDTGKHEAVMLEVSEEKYKIIHYYKYRDDLIISEKITEFSR